jgi:hypothetical protein
MRSMLRYDGPVWSLVNRKRQKVQSDSDKSICMLKVRRRRAICYRFIGVSGRIGIGCRKRAG